MKHLVSRRDNKIPNVSNKQKSKKTTAKNKMGKKKSKRAMNKFTPLFQTKARGNGGGEASPDTEENGETKSAKREKQKGFVHKTRPL